MLLENKNAETPAAPAVTWERALDVTLWVAQVLLALFFAFAGINKLGGLQQEVVAALTEIGFGQWFRYFTGVLELAGAVGLLIPRLSGVAALGLAGVMVGAVLTHLFFLPPVALALVPALLGVVFGLIAWGRWPQTKALTGKLKP